MATNYEIYQEIKSDFEKSNKNKGGFFKTRGNYKMWLYWIILFLVFLPQIVLLLTKKSYEYTENLDNLSEPIQTLTSWWVNMKIHWVDVKINFLAEYDISWKVISAKDYAWTDIEKWLSPRDFVLWRWKMSRQEIIDKFNWNDYRNRFIYAYVPEENANRFDAEFSWNIKKWDRWTVRTQFSNNHIIPANKKVRRLIKKIKEWDVVRLKWYLVYVHFQTKQWYRERHSSMSRDDRWDHSCEVFYVTDVTRLKEKLN